MVLGVECGGGGCRLLLQGRGRGQSEPKVSPPQLRQSQPRGAGLAAGRPCCGHIWGTAAGPGPEQVTWHRQARPGAYKAKTPGGAVVNMPDMNPRQKGCTLQCRHARTQVPQPHTATASRARPPRLNATSQLCDLKQTTQLLWASVASVVKGALTLLLRSWIIFSSFDRYSPGCLLCARHCTRLWGTAGKRTVWSLLS